MAAKINVYDQDMTSHLLIAAYRLMDAPRLEEQDARASQDFVAKAVLALGIASLFSSDFSESEQDKFDSLNFMKIIRGGKMTIKGE